MKFKIGDKTDTSQCIALEHEFLRCRDAFLQFQLLATISIMEGNGRLLSYEMHKAYSAFVHHLYEFIRGAHVRESQNTRITNKYLTRPERAKLDEDYIADHTQRLLTNRRTAILNGTAPSWENDISYYPEEPPPEFPSEFRKYRNLLQGHVSHERPSGLNLSEFYAKYHKFLFLLFQDCAWWAPRGKEFPDLKEITAFSVLVTQQFGAAAPTISAK